MKRLVLGDDQVQALDYAYTLQGWLKALNHPDLATTLAPTLAAGNDGQTNGVAADAFGMVLGYYRGDYVRTGTYLNAAPGSTPNPILTEPSAQQQLFNGNIATWSSKSLRNTAADPKAISTATAEGYAYDQLNRLLASEQSLFDAKTGKWGVRDHFRTGYSYDANGNLQTLQRNGNSPAPLDELTYTYQLTADKLPTNRLRHVKDKVASSVSDEDVDSQADDNYAYDGVGNLIRDNQAGVSSISWTPYGKMAQVVRPGKLTSAYLYDAQGQRIRQQRTVAGGAAGSKTTYYVRDAQGNPLAIYEAPTPTSPAQLVEQPLYGSARLGQRQPAAPLPTAPPPPGVNGATYGRVLGQKLYELSDHLGNVRAVVTDEKSSTLSSTTGQPLNSSLQPVLRAYYNYYAFGQLQPGRYSSGSTGAGGYRYGYNGKEKDNNGELGLTNYDYGFRIYNPGLGRFLSVDPLKDDYPFYTPFQFAGNTPIAAIDIDGLEPQVVVQKAASSNAALIGTATITEASKTAVQNHYNRVLLRQAERLLEQGAKEYGPTVVRLARPFSAALLTVALVFTPANNGSGAMRASLTGEDAFQKDQFKKLANRPYSTLSDKEKSTLNYLRQFFDFDEKGDITGSLFRGYTFSTSSKFGNRILVVDENLSPSLAAELKELGYNVKIFEKGTLDPEIIAFAKSVQGIVMTNNIDDFKKQGITTIKITETLKRREYVPFIMQELEKISEKYNIDNNSLAPGVKINISAPNPSQKRK